MSKDRSLPPHLAVRFLRWFCKPELVEDVEGDLSELYDLRRSSKQSNVALKYWLDVLLLIRPDIIKNIELKNRLIHTDMVKNYLKIALRNALRYKGFTVINLLGLIIGITVSSIIFLWVNDEVSVDKFHSDGDQIYQVFRNMKQSGSQTRTTWTIPKPAADMLREEFSEVDQVVQVSWPMDIPLRLEEAKSEEQGYFVSPEFLEMFSFEWLEGDKETSLDELNSIIISRRVAEKYFGSTWKQTAIGSTMGFNNEYDVMVSGVMEDVGSNSSLQFDWLMPAQSFFNENPWVNDWGNGSFRIYFTLQDAGKVQAVADRIKDAIIVHAAGQDNAGGEELILHKFQDYYLYSNFTNGQVDGGRITYVNVLITVAIFILLVACINFMNLTTARSNRRSKEVGLRKVMGARRSSVSVQFILESLLMTTLATLVSLLLVSSVIPYLNQALGKELKIDFSNEITWYYSLGLIVIVGFLSGSYPAFLLPRFKIIQSLKGLVKQGSGASMVRRGLVVFQFTISTFLIIAISVVSIQLDYVLSKDLGLNKENLIMVGLNSELANKWEVVKTEIGNIPEVTAVTVTSGNPIDYGRSTSSAKWEGMSADQNYEINIMLSDKSFVKTTEATIVNGRDFSDDLKDSTSFLINQVAADLMGFDDPVGKKLSFWGIDGRIIGVIKNYHMEDMYEPISPLIVSCIAPERTDVALFRVTGNTNEVIKQAESILSSLSSGFEFEYEFVDQAYAENYNTEVLVSNLIRWFAGVSIFLSCLGLFGLSSFTTEQRSKEIGIRKVHGASISSLVLLLSKDYSKLMILAFLLAIPFGYYYSNQWLSEFEFRTVINPFLYVFAGGIVFVVGGFTVSFKSIQAAKSNPVNTLKDE